MTFVGKVLVVVQLVLSLCFMAFAGALFTVQDNWRQEATKMKAERDAAETKVSDLQAELDAYKDEATAKMKNMDERANDAEGKLEAAQTSIREMKDELSTVKTERDTQRELALNATEEAKIRQAEAIAEHEVNSRLLRTLNESGVEKRALTDEIFNKDVREDQLIEKHSRLLDEYAALKKGVSSTVSLQKRPSRGPAAKTPAPNVKGEVTVVRKAKDNSSELVQISIGSDDGLQEGHSLSVYRFRPGNDRASMYLGEIEIVYVRSDKAVGQVIHPAKNGEIEVGDNVTTKL